MRICYFGTYNPDYERNRVIIGGLKKNGVTVIEYCSRDSGFRAYLRLMRMRWSGGGHFDFVIVGYSDRPLSVLLARILFACPVVWDAFYSSYDTYVYDRKLVSSGSFKALMYWLQDWVCCVTASRILLDTDAHIRYFVETFWANKRKFIRSFVGASNDIFQKCVEQGMHGTFEVLFFGNYIPLQGVQYIVEAAKLLEDDSSVHFTLVGSGQTFAQVYKCAADNDVKNVTFLERQSIRKLSELIAEADICLGIFGNTGKASRVIPNKAIEAVATGKPLITAETSAIRELFTDRKDILLCRAADPADLAEKIRLLQRDSTLRERIAAGGYETYLAWCTPKIIGRDLLSALERRA